MLSETFDSIDDSQWIRAVGFCDAVKFYIFPIPFMLSIISLFHLSFKVRMETRLMKPYKVGRM